MTEPLKPKIVRGEIVFEKSNVVAVAADKVLDGDYVENKAKRSTERDFKAAATIIDNAADTFTHALDRFLAVEKRYTDSAKRASGSVRDSAEKLAQGLGKIEKLANFSRLEQYVTLLERAATAMTTLAELEKSGKLEKIAGAIR